MTHNLSTDAQHQARMARQLIRAAGGLEAAAEISGKGKSQIARYQSPHDEASITLEVIEALESVTSGSVGHPIITRYLAMRAGYVLVQLPQKPANGTDLLSLVSQQAKESGDITSGIINALADKQWTNTELVTAQREVQELIEVAVAMQSELALIQDDQGFQ